MKYNKEIFYQEYIRREDTSLRAPYNPELEFYSIIQSGDTEQTKELCKSSPLKNKKGLGILSNNPVNNIRYHFVITTALIARYCIEGGLDVATAYNLSDFYIKKADKMDNIDDISELHAFMCIDYAKKMRSLKKNLICSKPVAECIDYIYDHLHTKITVELLANKVNLTPAYLSRLFKKETGDTISHYIKMLKLSTAKNMLMYSEYSPSQIAQTLAFPSQSYFTEQFRIYTGLTPVNYRNSYFRQTPFNNTQTSSDYHK